MKLLVFIGVPILLLFIISVMKSAKEDMAWLGRWGGKRFRKVYASFGIAILVFSSFVWGVGYRNAQLIPIGIIAFAAGIILIFASIWNTWKDE